MVEEIVVDAEGLKAGRLASVVAKELISGKRVVVVNAEKALISGNRKAVIGEWTKKLEIRSAIHPKHGPFHPRTPDGILTKIIKGMISHRKPKGVMALKRLRVYIHIPDPYARREKYKPEEAKATRADPFYVSVGDIAKSRGWEAP